MSNVVNFILTLNFTPALYEKMGIRPMFGKLW